MWYYNNELFTDEMIKDYSGFVYIITDLNNQMQYIGQKNFWMPKTKTINGKKKKIKVISDYKDYFGSNDALKARVKELGPEHFKREILHLCVSKGMQNYIELREQIDRRALEKPDNYYNSFVGGKIHRKHLKLGEINYDQL